MKFDIALCTNENYAVPCMTCIVSIMENNAGNDITFHVLNNGITTATSNKFRKLEEIYQCKINLIEKGAEELQGVNVREQYTIVTYYRFFLSDILKNLSKVLYLDCDIMVRGKLNDLWNTDITDKACAVVNDQSSYRIEIYNNLNLKFDGSYFNAGMMLINLDYWREHDISHQCLEYAINNRERCIICDQDALNVIIKDKVKHISPKYNMQDSWTKPIKYQAYYFAQFEIVEQEMKNPVVVHFCNPEKPWHIEKHNPWDSNPWKEEYLHYARMHAFIGFKMQRCHSLKYRIIRRIIRTLEQFI